VSYPRGRKRTNPPTLGTNNADWMTPKNLAYLRDNWLLMSMNALARALGTSKNAIVGKAHRMGLDPKPSPIVRKDGLPYVPRLASPVSVAAVNRPAWAVPVKPAAPVAAPRPVIAAPVRPVEFQEPRYAGRVEPCCWITSKGKPWLYCEDSSEPGRAYCQEHGRRAVVKRRDDGDTAAMYAGVG